MAIHSQRHGVCVCVCMATGKTILFHRGGGRVLLPPWGKQRDILFHRGGGGGEIHHDVHYFLKYKST